jgi:hypothetical protein
MFAVEPVYTASTPPKVHRRIALARTTGFGGDAAPKPGCHLIFPSTVLQQTGNNAFLIGQNFHRSGLWKQWKTVFFNRKQKNGMLGSVDKRAADDLTGLVYIRDFQILVFDSL